MNNGRLKHFKRKLLEKRELLAEMVQRTEGHARENESETMDAADLAVASYTKEVMFGMSSMDHQKLQLIGNALERIKNHSYGICINCEKEILFNRLEAVPWAPYCVKCQSLLEKNSSSEFAAIPPCQSTALATGAHHQLEQTSTIESQIT